MRQRVQRSVFTCGIVALGLAGIGGQATPDARHGDVVAARGKFEDDYQAALSPVYKRYRTRLEGLAKTFKQKGDMQAAADVAAELEWLEAQKAALPGGASIEGNWIVKYSSGIVRNYTALANGTLIAIEGDTKRTGRLTPQGGSYLLDFGDGKAERLTLRPALIVEHFSSANLLRNGSPADLHATGQRPAKP